MSKLSHNKSIKHVIIDKANTTMLIAVSVSVFIFVFSLFAVRALVNQSSYHNRVIAAQRDALKTLRQNKIAADELRESYIDFAGPDATVNVLGGNPKAEGPRDGDNAIIVLDSLPAEYDFPALSSSIEKILVDGGYQISTIGGSEDASQNVNNTGASAGVGQQSATQSASSSSSLASSGSTLVDIPFPFSVSGSEESITNLLLTLERSIRPFYVTALSIEGSGDSLEASIGLKTFYQPKTSFQVTTKGIE